MRGISSTSPLITHPMQGGGGWGAGGGGALAERGGRKQRGRGSLAFSLPLSLFLFILDLSSLHVLSECLSGQRLESHLFQ